MPIEGLSDTPIKCLGLPATAVSHKLGKDQLNLVGDARAFALPALLVLLWFFGFWFWWWAWDRWFTFSLPAFKRFLCICYNAIELFVIP